MNHPLQTSKKSHFKYLWILISVWLKFFKSWICWIDWGHEVRESEWIDMSHEFIYIQIIGLNNRNGFVDQASNLNGIFRLFLNSQPYRSKKNNKRQIFKIQAFQFASKLQRILHGKWSKIAVTKRNEIKSGNYSQVDRFRFN